MARRRTGRRVQPAHSFRYCESGQIIERDLPRDLAPGRAGLIRTHDRKWANGTVLHYAFFDKPARWKASAAEKRVVRSAFKKWKDLGIGLEFSEVASLDEAEIRIAFQSGDGAWSYIGRDVLMAGQSEPTMNFGWDITSPGEIDTALHEIGHTLGFNHEHQSPNGGIVWDEDEVYRQLAGPPNRWSRETTWQNIIRKLDPSQVRGSDWDPNSIMHYPFEPDLILKPEKYRKGLTPDPGLSAKDKTWARKFYPKLTKASYKKLVPFRSLPFSIDPGGQIDMRVVPEATRKYTFSTFGESDSVMVLFEDVDGELRYRTADDDSGEARNARIHTKLFAGREYVLRLRLYYAHRAGDLAVMMW